MDTVKGIAEAFSIRPSFSFDPLFHQTLQDQEVAKLPDKNVAPLVWNAVISIPTRPCLGQVGRRSRQIKQSMRPICQHATVQESQEQQEGQEQQESQEQPDCVHRSKA